MRHTSPASPPAAGGPQARQPSLVTRAAALEHAADLAVLAPSVHNTQPWLIHVAADSLSLRADRSRQLAVLDPHGRKLAISLGAALFNARVALAAHGWAVAVERFPHPDDPDLLAIVRPVRRQVDSALRPLADAIASRHTNRRRFDDTPIPGDLLHWLVESAAAEEAILIPLLTVAQRHLVAELTREADRLQNADPAYRAELRYWTTRPQPAGDGIPPTVVPHVDGRQDDEVPLRDFDTQGTGQLPAQTHSSTDQNLVLLATHADDRAAWLRTGEAMQRILLELTLLGWVASPITQAIEVPLTHGRLRAALTGVDHPQMLLRIGMAAPTTAAPRRHRSEVVTSSWAAKTLPCPRPPAVTE